MRALFKRYRTSLLVWLTHGLALPVLRQLRKAPVRNYTMEELSHLPEGTLGSDLYYFLQQRQLRCLPHYIRHDIKHVLLEYDTTDVGEACLQCCMLGTGRVSFPVLATVAYAAITMPEHWGRMRNAWRRGRSAVFFHDWPWMELLTAPTQQLRRKIFIQQNELK